MKVIIDLSKPEPAPARCDDSTPIEVRSLQIVVKDQCAYCGVWSPEFDTCPHCGAPYMEAA
jgi:primosomal protein N'